MVSIAALLGATVLVARLTQHAPQPSTSTLASAAINGDVAAVHARLAAGDDPNAFADHGFLPLDWAARFGQVETMRALFDAGAKLDKQDDGPNGWTPIQHALHKNQTKAALALLEWGADPNSRSRSGETPLMRAACQGNLEVVRYLLAHGADPRAETQHHRNALHFCLNGGNAVIAKAILDKAPDLRVADDLEVFVSCLVARLRGDDELVRVVHGGAPHD
jgi:ankyrin repeat protein